jgi:hypothetical protein
MFCTQCHTGFNWRTGRIEAVIHNPHYFEWLRRNGNQVPRTPGDVPCGQGRNDLTHRTYIDIQTVLRQALNADNPLRPECERLLSNIIRNTIHLRYVVRNRYDVGDRVRRNEELRIRYMRNQITEDEFKTNLQRNQKKVDKYTELYNILDILLTTVTDIVYRFNQYLVSTRDGNWNMTILNEINPIVDYANECLTEISKTYTSKSIQFNYEILEV